MGAILFEMLTGQRAFQGESFGEIAHAVLHGTPPALSGPPAIAAMGRIVHRALARESQHRYPNAKAMAEELRAALLMDGIETKARACALRRLIVLPFRVLRPSEEIQFLAYSLPEAITVSLAGLENLVVRSSIVAAQYSGDAPDLQKIAREAEVDVVLTGALLNVGKELRITTQLAEVPSGTLLWSHSSQATTHELLELHDDLVRRVVESILPSLTVQEHQLLQKDRPASPTVYQIYLQANEFGRRWENLPTAIQMYERCVSLDPSYASGWARLGRARWLRDKYTLGSLEGLRAADEAFQTALRLNPSLTLAHNLYTHVQVDQGRSLDAMKRLLDRAHQRRSDAELLISTSVMHTYFMLGDYEHALETSANDYGYGMALVLAMHGRVEEAVSLLRQRELAKPWRLGKLYLTSLRALLEGEREESLATSDELMKDTFRDPEGMYYLARQFSYLRAEGPALEMLSRAINNGFFCHQAMVRDPWLDALRARAEFTDLLRKAHQLHREASTAFLAGGGPALLGIRSEGY